MLLSSEYRRQRAEHDLARTWPQWKIHRLLGTGSYGEVYEISKEEYGITSYAALKVLRVEEGQPAASPAMQGARNAKLGDSFIRNISNEINIMEQLKGAPGIVVIEDYAVLRDKEECTILIRMELLLAITNYFREGSRVDEAEVLKLGIDICRALACCEERNIIHRDIKESNLFRDRFGNYKLGDFGISRYMESVRQSQTMTGTGTLSYMAPEVYRGQPYNNTADLYSLGIVLYNLMNGMRLPFTPSFPNPVSENDFTYANMRRINGEMLPLPAFASPKLASVLMRACDPNPARRYQTAKDFCRALEACAERENEKGTAGADRSAGAAGPSSGADQPVGGAGCRRPSSGADQPAGGAGPYGRPAGGAGHQSAGPQGMLRRFWEESRLLTVLFGALALVVVFSIVYSMAAYGLPAIRRLKKPPAESSLHEEIPEEHLEGFPEESRAESETEDSAVPDAAAGDVAVSDGAGIPQAGSPAEGAAVAPGKDVLPASQQAEETGGAGKTPEEESSKPEEAETPKGESAKPEEAETPKGESSKPEKPETSEEKTSGPEADTPEAEPDVPVFGSYPHMAVHFDEIPSDLFAEITSDLEAHILARDVGRGKYGVHIESMQYVGAIFMGRRASVYDSGNESEYKNKLFPVYEVTAVYDKEENGKVYSAEITNYYYRRYLNIELTGEGTADTDLSVSTDPKPSTVTLISSDGKERIEHAGYQGLPTLEEVMDFLCPRNEDAYYIEYEEG